MVASSKVESGAGASRYEAPEPILWLFGTPRNQVEADLVRNISGGLNAGRGGIHVMSAATEWGKTTTVPFILSCLAKVYVVQGPRKTGETHKFLTTDFHEGVLKDFVALLMENEVEEGDFTKAVNTMVTTGWLKARAKNLEQFKEALKESHILLVHEANTMDLPMALLLQKIIEYQQELDAEHYPLHVVIVSATLDVSALEMAWGHKINCYDYPSITPFVVNQHFVGRDDAHYDRVPQIIEEIGKIRSGVYANSDGTKPEEGILVFVSGTPEIAACLKQMALHYPALRQYCHALHGQMHKEDQEKLAKLKGFKIIFATSIAETGVTVSGCGFVIDTCVKKEMVYKSNIGEAALEEVLATTSIIIQRMGRVGRLSEGHAIIMCTREYFERRRKFAVSKTVLGDCFDLVIQWVELFPMSLPIAENYAAAGFNMIIEPLKDIVVNAAKIHMAIGTMIPSPVPAHPLGMILTPSGEYALRHRLGVRPAMFWRLSQKSDSLEFTRRMAQLAVILHLNGEKKTPIIGQYQQTLDFSEVVSTDSGMFPDRRQLDSLSSKDLNVAENGDLYADLVALLAHEFPRRQMASYPYFQKNPSFKEEHRDEARKFIDDLFGARRNYLAAVPKPFGHPDEIEIGIRLCRIYPDRILSIYHVGTSPGGTGVVTGVKGRKIATRSVGQSFNIATSSAFDFASYAGPDWKKPHPIKELYILYLSFTIYKDTFMVSRIMRIPTESVYIYLDHFWGGWEAFTKGLHLDLDADGSRMTANKFSSRACIEK